MLTAAPVPGADGPLELSTAPMSYAVTYVLEGLEDDVPAPLDTPDTVRRRLPAQSPRRATSARPSRSAFAVLRHAHLQRQPRRDRARLVDHLPPSRRSSSSNGTPEPTVETIVPGAGIGDWRLDAVLADLVADGSFVLRERRTLLGRGVPGATAPVRRWRALRGDRVDGRDVRRRVHRR
jgi:hypothetical protein